MKGPLPGRRSFATGVETPNSSAAASPIPAPLGIDVFMTESYSGTALDASDGAIHRQAGARATLASALFSRSGRFSTWIASPSATLQASMNASGRVG